MTADQAETMPLLRSIERALTILVFVVTIGVITTAAATTYLAVETWKTKRAIKEAATPASSSDTDRLGDSPTEKFEKCRAETDKSVDECLDESVWDDV